MGTARHRKLAHVALAAGVSEATASRALNGQPNVSEASRQKVLAAAIELGYSPEPAGRILREGAIPLIGIVMSPHLSDDPSGLPSLFYHRFLATFVAETSANGCAVTTITQSQAADGLSSFPLSALVITGRDAVAQVPDGLAFGVPVLALGPYEDDPRIRSSARHNVDAIVGACMEHLRERGARQIALVDLRLPGLRRDEIRASYEAWCLESGNSMYAIDPNVGVPAESIAAAVRSGCDAILDFSYAPQTLLDGIELAGVRVPHDVLAISQGEGVLEQAMRVPMTTVSFMGVESARRCAAAVAQLLATGTAPAFELPFEIAPRSSTARETQ